MAVSAGPESRTAIVRRYRGEDWFTSTEPTWGVDEETGLEVQADPTGWVTDVRIGDVDPALRTDEGLRGGLVRAIADATLHHVAARAQQRRLTTEQVLTARELLSGRRRLTVEHVPRPAPITYPRGPVHVAATVDKDVVTRTWAGASRDGELRIVMTAIAGLRRVESAPGFLDTTNGESLRYAIREAFADATTEMGVWA